MPAGGGALPGTGTVPVEVMPYGNENPSPEQDSVPKRADTHNGGQKLNDSCKRHLEHLHSQVSAAPCKRWKWLALHLNIYPYNSRKRFRGFEKSFRKKQKIYEIGYDLPGKSIYYTWKNRGKDSAGFEVIAIPTTYPKRARLAADRGLGKQHPCAHPDDGPVFRARSDAEPRVHKRVVLLTRMERAHGRRGFVP